MISSFRPCLCTSWLVGRVVSLRPGFVRLFERTVLPIRRRRSQNCSCRSALGRRLVSPSSVGALQAVATMVWRAKNGAVALGDAADLAGSAIAAGAGDLAASTRAGTAFWSQFAFARGASPSAPSDDPRGSRGGAASGRRRGSLADRPQARTGFASRTLGISTSSPAAVPRPGLKDRAMPMTFGDRPGGRAPRGESARAGGLVVRALASADRRGAGTPARCWGRRRAGADVAAVAWVWAGELCEGSVRYPELCL